MKSLKLKKNVLVRDVQDKYELTLGEVESPYSSFVPGEWVVIQGESSFLAFVVQKKAAVFKLALKLGPQAPTEEDERGVGERCVLELLAVAETRRRPFKQLQESERLVFGQADGLYGLIVDRYENLILIQIHSAGIDRYREVIQKFYQQKFPETAVHFLDQHQLREKEALPTYQLHTPAMQVVRIQENALKLEIDFSKIQKNGYYLDHRDNRLRCEKLLGNLNLSFKSGLDLFCYIGSWGLHLLRGGVEKVTFVDQADMESSIARNLELNGFKGQGTFFRDDVFSYLERAVEKGELFDSIVVDPPAFAKDFAKKAQALSGYRKLFGRVVKLLDKNALLVSASCTYYIHYEEFATLMYQVLVASGRKFQLIDIGLQGPDHPTRSLVGKENYIKYLAYLVE